ncbi:MAG: hypothetical protein IIT45_02575, partial [Treponema sp.]|nr:hypothetical protein [Treponema sp.]
SVSRPEDISLSADDRHMLYAADLACRKVNEILESYRIQEKEEPGNNIKREKMNVFRYFPTFLSIS